MGSCAPPPVGESVGTLASSVRFAPVAGWVGGVTGAVLGDGGTYEGAEDPPGAGLDTIGKSGAGWGREIGAGCP
ncbi:MAG: hypothetical protein M0Q92_05795, partial [Methanoregula sp.]|nr:hypothetical protein [Methanoregula sp.]